MLLPGLDDPRRAIDVAERIRTAFERPFTVGLHEVFTSVSIGIAFAQGDRLGAGRAAPRRHRDVPRQGARPLAIRALRRRDGSRGPHPRSSSSTICAARIQRDELRALLPAGSRDRHGPAGRHGGAGALGTSDARPDPARRVPVGRRGDRADRADRPLGAARGVPPGARSGRRSSSTDVALMVSVNLSGKHLQQSSLIDEVQEVLKDTGLRAAASDHRDHRDRRDGRRRDDDRDSDEAESARGAARHRRLRHRVLEPVVSEALPGRSAEDRQVVRRRRREQRPRHGDRRGDHRARTRARSARHRRRRGTSRAAAAAALARVRAGSGILLRTAAGQSRQPGACRRCCRPISAGPSNAATRDRPAWWRPGSDRR